MFTEAKHQIKHINNIFMVEGKRSRVEVNKPINFSGLRHDISTLYIDHYYYQKQTAELLSNCFITPKGIVLSNLKYVKGSFYSPNSYKKTYYKDALKLYVLSFITRWGRANKKTYNNKNTYAIIHQPYINYYHWLIESLSRLMVLEKQNKPYILLIPEQLHRISYIKEYLQLLNVKYEIVESEKTIYVKHLLLPSIVWWASRYEPEIILRLKERILSGYIEKTGHTETENSRVFVVRGTGRRKIVNLDEIAELAKKYKFNLVDFDGLSVEDQIKTAKNAKVLVGQHGAGLSNILFMSAGATVVELVADPVECNGVFDDAYSVLASTNRLNYYVVFCNKALPSADFYTTDYIVPAQELEQVFVSVVEND